MFTDNKLHSWLILLPLLVLLSGCQSLSGLFGEDQAHLPIVFDEPQIQLQPDIEKHQFALAPEQTLIGKLATIETQENDTLSDIARHFGLGYNDITIANEGIPAWTPQAGSHVLLPLQFILPDAAHKGIVLNLANMRMFYYPKNDPQKVMTYPIGIGRDGWYTPMGSTSIAVKTEKPTWHVPPSILKEHADKGQPLPSEVRSGPENPLGLYAMRLDIPSYLIHGTNKPYGIGMQVSHGCVQMYPENIETLFKKVAVGTPVRIIHQPYLSAWHEDMLYVEANEPLEKWAPSKPKLKKELVKTLKTIEKQHNVKVDWGKVDQVIERSNGIPTPVLINSPDIAELSQQAMQLAHPGKFYGQPVATAIKDSDLAVLVGTYKNELEAQQLTAMLNHQGPQIPARKIQAQDSFKVVAGPFKNKKEAKSAANRIRSDFEIDKLKEIKGSEIH